MKEREVYKVACTMAKEVAAGVLKSERFRFAQPRLEKVNQVPSLVMREDGRIELLRPGYDWRVASLRGQAVWS